MTIENDKLKKAGIVLLSVLIASGLAYGVYAAREAYLANLAHIASLEAEVASEKAEADALSSLLAERDAELAATNEKYGVALDEKSAAEAEAESAKGKAASASSEAARQKGLADKANGELAVCTDNGEALAYAAYYLELQRGYWQDSAHNVALAAESFLWEDYETGISHMENARYYADLAKSLQSNVDYWLGEIE